MIHNTHHSYGSVTKFLHWLIALLVLLMLCVGVSFSYLPHSPFSSFLMQIHKSTGITILFLMAIRLFWRWMNPTPALPKKTPLWEHIAIRVVHYLFYLVIIAMPITGIIMTMAGSHPLAFWWLFNIHLPFIPEDKALSRFMFNWHNYLAWTVTALIVLHTLAALKHHFINKNNILKRMMPGK
ncbi:MAG: cytochrome b [Gammaproteobacteria bacterium]|nr:cytochrome b [Gammaproteobacteria bacterium]